MPGERASRTRQRRVDRGAHGGSNCPGKSVADRECRRVDRARTDIAQGAIGCAVRGGTVDDPTGTDDIRQHDLRAGQRQQSQHSADIAAESSTADENDPLTVLTMLMGELHGDAPAERVADHGYPGDTELIEQIAQQYGEGTNRVVTAGLVG